VWSLRTTPSKATGFTPFFLVYGAEAVLPTDLEYGSPRVRGYDEGTNQRARKDSLDQLDEARTVAMIHLTRYQQALRRYQARRIRCRDFNEGGLVLRLRQDNRGRQKLSPPWEGPYVIVKVLKPGTYKLANEDGKELTNPVGDTNVNFHRINKVKGLIKSKGDSAFPRKPNPPRGLLRGAFPQKMVPFFAKIHCKKC
jgi:hypothetical protein